MGSSTPVNTAVTKQLSSLFSLLENIESGLVELTGCLQKEREYLTVFELNALNDTLTQKATLLESLQRDQAQRKQIFLSLWSLLEKNAQDLPTHLPQALRAIAGHLPDASTSLIEHASRFDALLDVIQELQHINQGHLQRATFWIDSCLRELTGNQQSHSYDASGHKKKLKANPLRNSI